MRTLYRDDIAALLKGEGIGMAKTAELNGYPGPAHVLALAKELKLSNEQRRRAIGERAHCSVSAVSYLLRS